MSGIPLLYRLNTSTQFVRPARNRGFKTIQLEVLMEAAMPPQPTGLSYLWHLIRKVLGLTCHQEAGFEDLLTPVEGKEDGPTMLGEVCDAERSRWDIFLFTIRILMARRCQQRWKSPEREAWEDVDYWHGPPRSDGAGLDGEREGEEGV